MTTPPRPTSNWEAATEAAIRISIAAGEFADLPGTGQPIPGLDGAHDELWWVKQKLAAEQVDTLPPSLRLRRERELTIEAAMACESEARVRTLVSELNDKIRKMNKYGTTGPPTSLMPVDIDRFVERWRAARNLPGATAD